MCTCSRETLTSHVSIDPCEKATNIIKQNNSNLIFSGHNIGRDAFLEHSIIVPLSRLFNDDVDIGQVLVKCAGFRGIGCMPTTVSWTVHPFERAALRNYASFQAIISSEHFMYLGTPRDGVKCSVAEDGLAVMQ